MALNQFYGITTPFPTRRDPTSKKVWIDLLYSDIAHLYLHIFYYVDINLYWCLSLKRKKHLAVTAGSNEFFSPRLFGDNGNRKDYSVR